MVPVEPLPLFEFIGFHHYRFPLDEIHEDVQSYIVFLALVENIIRIRAATYIGYLGQAGFFCKFSEGAFFRCFSIFQMAARKRPRTIAVGTFPFSKENLIFA